MEDEKPAYVDSFNFDEEMNRIETGFGETVSKEAPKKFLIDSNLHSKPVDDPYIKFLEYQKNKQTKPAARNTQQKLSGSVDSNDRASGFNFKSVQNVVEENEQPNKWTPPTRLRSMESKPHEQINKSQEQDHPPHYQNINVSNNFVASLNQDFVKEDGSDSMTRNPPPYKTFKLPGPLPTIRKEEVVFAAAHQNKRAEEPENKKTPPLNMGDKRSLIFKQQSSLPEKTNREGLNSSRANKTKVNLHQKILPPTYSKKGAVADEQAIQENYRRLNEEEVNLQNEIVDLHLKETAKKHQHQLNQTHSNLGRAPPTLFPNFPLPENVVKEEELEESLDRLDTTTGAKPKTNHHMAVAYVLPTPTYLLNHQQNPQSQVSSSSQFYGQQQPRESPSLGLPVISHHQRFMPQLMQVSSHNLTSQYNKNSATAFQGFPPSSTTSYNGNQYPINFNHQYRSVNFNDDVSSHASLNMNHTRVSFERFTPNNKFGTGQPFQQQQWQKAYGNNGPEEIRDQQQVFGKTSLSHLNKETERLLSSTENLKQSTNPNDISGSSEYSENVKSILKGGGGRSTIRDESVGYGTRKQQMKDYQLKKKIAAQQKKEKPTSEKVGVEPPPIIEKETIEGGMKVVTNTNLIHLLMGGGNNPNEEEEEEEEEEGEE